MSRETGGWKLCLLCGGLSNVMEPELSTIVDKYRVIHNYCIFSKRDDGMIKKRSIFAVP